MATFKTTCPGCKSTYKVDDSHLGRNARCAKCGTRFKIESTRAVGAASAPTEKPAPVGLPAAAADEAKVPAEWNVGDVILDLYEVTGILGEGGMGKVYKVHHRGWNLDLAVKCPKPDFFHTDRQKENFTAECETWIKLGLHPHIVSCHYVRTLGGIPRVFAECVEGGTLKDWIESGKLYEGGPDKALERILDIAIQFAWGLHYAHEHEEKLIHQDVKPANVMMTPDGVAKVTDFGLAKARAVAGEVSTGDRQQSILVSSAGMTPAYCSPEQANNEKLSRKTDIWSWGLSILEMFTGGVTWMSGVAALEALDAHVEMDAGDESIPKMPDALTELLRRCFQDAPDSRPKDMADVATTVKVVYQEVVGHDCPRVEPKAAELLADALNNRAVSMLDLGRTEDTERLCGQALQADPHHPEATYHRGLLLWRSGRTTDDELIRQLEEVGRSRPDEGRDKYLRARVHLERGDCEAAISVLEASVGSTDLDPDVGSELSVARGRLNNSRRLAATLEGHSAAVSSLCVSCDQPFLVSGSGDSSLKIWELFTGQCIRTITGDGGAVLSLCLSDDGQFALLGRENGNLEFWNISTGRLIQSHKAHTTRVFAVSMSSDFHYAISGGMDHKARLWDLRHERCSGELGYHPQEVTAVWMSADGSKVVTASGSDLRLWDLRTNHVLRAFEGHDGGVLSICLTRDQRYLLSGCGDRTLKLWEVATGRCVRTLQGHMNWVTSVGMTPDGRHAVSGDRDGTIRFWEIPTGRCLRTFQGCHLGARGPWWQTMVVWIRDDAKQAFSGGADHTVKIWNLDWDLKAPVALCRISSSREAAESEQAYQKALDQARVALKKGDAVASGAFIREARSQPGRQRAPEAIDQWCKLYLRLPRRSLAGVWQAKVFTGHTRPVTSACISADGQLALSGSGDATIKIWDTATGRCEKTLTGHRDTVFSLSLSRDERFAVSGSADWTMKLWDMQSGRCLRTYPHGAAVTAVIVLSDGAHALSGSARSLGDSVLLWHLHSRGPMLGFNNLDHVVEALSLSADERVAVSGSGYGNIDFWELPSGEHIQTVHDGGVRGLCLTPSGRHALSVGLPSTVDLWDVHTGTLLSTLEGHSDTIRAVSASADGRYAFSGSSDKTIKIWDMQSGQCLHTLQGHSASVTCLDVSADNRFCLSGGDDCTVRLWALDWELQDRRAADWDEGARSYLETFLTLQTPYASPLPRGRLVTTQEVLAALTRCGRPEWSANDFSRVMHTLGCAGYGWLRQEGVRRELERMSHEWTGPPPLPGQPRKDDRNHDVAGEQLEAKVASRMSGAGQSLQPNEAAPKQNQPESPTAVGAPGSPPAPPAAAGRFNERLRQIADRYKGPELTSDAAGEMLESAREIITLGPEAVPCCIELFRELGVEGGKSLRSIRLSSSLLVALGSFAQSGNVMASEFLQGIAAGTIAEGEFYRPVARGLLENVPRGEADPVKVIVLMAACRHPFEPISAGFKLSESPKKKVQLIVSQGPKAVGPAIEIFRAGKVGALAVHQAIVMMALFEFAVAGNKEAVDFMRELAEGRVPGADETDAKLARMCLKRVRTSDCFIATAACGTACAPDVVRLREFRDKVLKATWAGRTLMHAYERVSPALAERIRRSSTARVAVRNWIVTPARWLADRVLGDRRDPQ